MVEQTNETSNKSPAVNVYKKAQFEKLKNRPKQNIKKKMLIKTTLI